MGDLLAPDDANRLLRLGADEAVELLGMRDGRMAKPPGRAKNYGRIAELRREQGRG